MPLSFVSYFGELSNNFKKIVLGVPQTVFCNALCAMSVFCSIKCCISSTRKVVIIGNVMLFCSLDMTAHSHALGSAVTCSLTQRKCCFLPAILHFCLRKGERNCP
ncbi:UNVERIFIED_CONTAM: hypothetical protein K2H54_038259 [Gekko kuhli]